MSAPRFVVLVQTTENCGDHYRDVTVAHEVADGETIDSIVSRLLTYDTDVIEIRRVRAVPEE